MQDQNCKTTIGPGWDKFLKIAYDMLHVLDTVQQIEGKGEIILKIIDARRGFFYIECENVHSPYDALLERMHQSLRASSSKKCEICGEKSLRRKYFSWVPTLCKLHFIQSANYADDRKRAILAGEYDSPLGISPYQ